MPRRPGTGDDRADDRVASQHLGSIHEFVGGIHQLVGGGRRGVERGDADGGGHRRVERLLGEGGPDAAGYRCRFPGVGVGEEQDEFVAADAAEEVGSPDRILHPGRKALEQVVTHPVSEPIVDALEAVEVEVGDADRRALPMGPQALAIRRQLEGPAVQGTGQRIGGGVIPLQHQGPAQAAEEADDDHQDDEAGSGVPHGDREGVGGVGTDHVGADALGRGQDGDQDPEAEGAAPCDGDHRQGVEE